MSENNLFSPKKSEVDKLVQIKTEEFTEAKKFVFLNTQ